MLKRDDHEKENTMPTNEDPEILRKILRNATYDAEGAGAAAQSQADAAHDAAVETKDQIPSQLAQDIWKALANVNVRDPVDPPRAIDEVLAGVNTQLRSALVAMVECADMDPSWDAVHQPESHAALLNAKAVLRDLPAVMRPHEEMTECGKCGRGFIGGGDVPHGWYRCQYCNAVVCDRCAGDHFDDHAKDRTGTMSMGAKLREQVWTIAGRIEWTEEDWRDFHDSLTAVFTRIAARHRAV